MITIALKELEMGIGVLEKIFNYSFPIKIAYKLIDFKEIINKEHEKYETLRKELFTKYGENKDNNITIKPENTEEFYKEFNELLTLNITIDELPLTIDELCNESNLKLSVNEVILIKKFIKEENTQE